MDAERENGLLMVSEEPQSYSDDFSGTVLANTGSGHILLRDVALHEMRTLIAEFGKLHKKWLSRLLRSTTTQRDAPALMLTGKVIQRPVYGLSVRFEDKKGLRIYRFSHLAKSKIPDYVWIAAGLNEGSPNQRLTALVEEKGHEGQRLFVDALMDAGPDPAVFLNPGYLMWDELTTLFATARTTTEFIERVIALKLATDEQRPGSGRKKDSERYLPFLPSVFLFWLALKGIILLPPRLPVITPGPDLNGLARELVEEVLPGFLSFIEEHYCDDEDKSRFVSEVMPQRREAALLCMLASTTMRSTKEAVPRMFGDIRDASEARSGRVSRKTNDPFKAVFRAINRMPGSPSRQTDVPLRNSAERYLGSGLSWTALRKTPGKSTRHPACVPDDYTPCQPVLEWAHLFQSYLSRHNGKTQGRIVAGMNVFLAWLANAPDRKPSPDKIGRTHIARRSGADSFLNHLDTHPVSPKTRNEYVRVMEDALRFVLDQEHPGKANPFDLSLDLSQTGPARMKTERNSIPRRIAHLLLDINGRNGFEFSRTIPEHHVTVRNSGAPRKEWFPAVAVLIDLLLRLPLRGFQARFLDSGEGDGTLFRLNAEGLPEMAPNRGRSSRAEGCLTVVTGADGSPRAGLYVNTNKTEALDDPGYSIAWCPPELVRHLLMLRDWQCSNNPIVNHVPCMERTQYENHANRDLILRMKTTYPLFRGFDSGGWPISIGRVRKYWNQLVARAEDEINASGGGSRLTLDRNGERVSVYDIHSLRVTGITNLLAAGLPPDIVQMVAGHSSIVITMYYNKIECDRLNEEMAKASARVISEMESLPGGHDNPGLSNMLPGSRDLALAMLSEKSPRSDGSVAVMSHGICPGGECSTGAPDKSAVPAGACSVCRYRLTGPAFLPGIVLNANRLMFELHECAKEIESLDRRIVELIGNGRDTRLLEGRREVLDLMAEEKARQWSAEVQYAEFVKNMMSSHEGETALVGGSGAIELSVERRHEMYLLQKIVDGASVVEGFVPDDTLVRHGTLLNSILATGKLDDLLVGLPPEVSSRAARLAGRTLCSLIPDDGIVSIAAGGSSVSDYPLVVEHIENLRVAARRGALPDDEAHASLLGLAPPRLPEPVHETRR